MNAVAFGLTLALVSGQLFKLSLLSNGGGLTILDLAILLLAIFGIFKLRFKLARPSLFLTSAGIFIFIAMLSLIFTPLSLNISQYLTSFFYTVRLGFYFLLGWEIYSGALPEIEKNIQKILIFSGAILAVLGLIQLVLLPDIGFLASNGWDPHYFRTVSTFLDPNFAGAYFTLTLLLLISHLRSGKILTPKVLLILFTVVYLALLTTFSRGAYLAFFLSFSTLTLLSKSFKLGVLTLLLTLGLLIGFQAYQQAVAIPKGVDRISSAKFRLTTWQQGGILFQKHPLFGVGYNAYRYALKQYRLADQEALSSHGSSTNDSSLLFVAATTGVIGLTAYLFFLATLIKTAWQKNLQKNIWGRILIAAILGSLIQSFFANTLFYPFILIWIILITIKLTD